jgi:hypothetical protein
MTALARTTNLAELTRRINEFAQQKVDYNTENVDNSYYEYCQSFGYLGADLDDVIRNAQVEQDTKDLIVQFAKDNTAKETLDLLSENSTMECTGIHILDGEIYSISIGELEEELDHNLMAAYSALSIEDRETVARGIDYCLSDSGYLYISMDCTRWVMVLDEEAFAEAVAEQNERNEA